jgi:HAE1 family hydrophobic/amphiphilic exporter-1
VAVVGGLAFSQLVTLYVTPVLYTYFDELQSWLRRRHAQAAAPMLAPPAAPARG